MILSKLPDVGTTIFTVMSALAKEHNAINLSQGFPDFDCDPLLHNLAYRAMQAGHNQYPPMRGIDILSEQIAMKYNALHQLSLDPVNEITVTAGAAEAIYSAITTIVHVGDEVIVIDPAYDLYKPAIILNGGIPQPFHLKTPGFKVDWDIVEGMVNERTRLIIINTPHNPIGRTLKEDDLKALEAIVEKTGIYVISDEVYEHLIFGGQQHESILRYPGLFNRGFAVFSFGKTYHITGWRVGYIVAPKSLTAEFRKVHQFNVFTVPTPLQYALAEYMKEPKHYLELPGFFEHKRNLLQEALKDSRLRPLLSEGSYFQLYDYSEISDKPDYQFVKDLTIQHGVAAIPMSVFYSNPDPSERLIRLCFGKTESTLLAAAERLSKL
ncbi:MAG: aminotransferase class I/II-fold pyridoxal phosphate-dependent enzyme [Saprospiraceae bacterium]|nr:aminotransferase class I/II-fold pyridoxal phosphate-dependent enzyme [Saprospiraceae bacterium]